MNVQALAFGLCLSLHLFGINQKDLPDNHICIIPKSIGYEFCNTDKNLHDPAAQLKRKSPYCKARLMAMTYSVR